jgi:AcrR family transcriptional regulator
VEITVDEAAHLAGVSPGLVFHYFGSQIGFRRALAEEAARELITQLEPDPALSHVRQLRGALDRFVVWAQQHPRLYVAVTSNGNADAREVHEYVLSTVSGWIFQIAEDIGLPATPAVSLAVSGWLAFTETVVQGWLAEPLLSREEVAALCEDTFYLALQSALADPARWRRVEAALAADPSLTTLTE